MEKKEEESQREGVRGVSDAYSKTDRELP